jgi:hypothetical protein
MSGPFIWPGQKIIWSIIDGLGEKDEEESKNF